MAIGASYGAILLGVAFTLLGIVVAGLGYAVLGLITPAVAQRYGLQPVAPATSGASSCFTRRKGPWAPFPRPLSHQGGRVLGPPLSRPQRGWNAMSGAFNSVLPAISPQSNHWRMRAARWIAPAGRRLHASGQGAG